MLVLRTSNGQYRKGNHPQTRRKKGTAAAGRMDVWDTYPCFLHKTIGIALFFFSYLTKRRKNNLTTTHNNQCTRHRKHEKKKVPLSLSPVIFGGERKKVGWQQKGNTARRLKQSAKEEE